MWVADKVRLEKLAREFDPAIRLATKDSWFWRALAWLLFICTFGRNSREKFLTLFATTIGPVIGIPAAWTADQVENLLAHEGRHVRHARILGFYIHPWVGLLFYFLLYIFLPLPIGFALCRVLFELDADKAKWYHMRRSGRWTATDVRARAESFANTVSSSAYGWSLPAPWTRRLFARSAEKVIACTGG